MGLIQDIKPHVRKLDIPAYMRGYGGVRRISTESLVIELFKRGISMTEIFGMYYALQAQHDAHDDEIFGSSEAGLHGQPLTVGEAQLVHGVTPVQTKQPF